MNFENVFVKPWKEVLDSCLDLLKKCGAFFKDWKINLKKIAVNWYFFIFLIFVILCIFTTLTTIKIENATITDPYGVKKDITLPLHDKGNPMEYVFNGTISFNMFSQHWVKIIPDDLVESIVINGSQVSLTGIGQGALSDYINGFNIDLSPYLSEGNNRIEIKMTNYGGAYSMDLQPSDSDLLIQIIMVISVLLLIVLMVMIFNSLKLNKKFPDPASQALIYSLIIAAAAVRVFMLQFRTGDFEEFIDWYNFIKANGGIFSLKYGYSEYPPLFSYLLVLATYVPIAKAAAVKIIIFIFDFLTAGIAASIVGMKYQEKKKPERAAFAFFAVLFAPSLLFNSSYWGQCDVIYVGLAILSILYLLKGKSAAAMAAYGLAISFKIQAIFILPVFFVLFMNKDLKFRYFFILPAVYIASFIPAFLFGRPIGDLFMNYSNQAKMYGVLSIGCPNFYQWITDKIGQAFTPAAVMLTVAAVLFLTFIVCRRGEKIGKDIMIKLSLLIALIVPFFMPHMHERYFLTADVLSIIYAFYFPRYAYVSVIIILISFFSYMPFMMGMTIVLPLQFLAIIMLGVIVLVGSDLFKSLYSGNIKES